MQEKTQVILRFTALLSSHLSQKQIVQISKNFKTNAEVERQIKEINT